jgi:hypothetical protein
MDYPKFYCSNCKCDTPHDVERRLLNPKHEKTRIALAFFSLGASEVIPSPNDKYLIYDEVQTTSTCLSCGKRIVTHKFE